MLFFFFSSRRRHTRLQGDWSSDVCSSDLDIMPTLGLLGEHHRISFRTRPGASFRSRSGGAESVPRAEPPMSPNHRHLRAMSGTGAERSWHIRERHGTNTTSGGGSPSTARGWNALVEPLRQGDGGAVARGREVVGAGRSAVRVDVTGARGPARR